MKKNLFLLIVLYSLATNAQQITFNRQYPNLTYQYPTLRDVVQAPDGGYVLANNQSVPFGNSSYAPFATDSLGNVGWEKLYGNDFSNSPFAIDATPDGGYIIAGQASGQRTNTYQDDGSLMKINNQGDTLWWKFYGDYSSTSDSSRFKEYFLDAKVTKDGNIIAVGKAYNRIINPYIVLTDPNGDTIWTWRPKLDSTTCRFCSVTETPEGDFIAIGIISGHSLLTETQLTTQIGLIVKVSKLGQTMWMKEWSGNTQTVFTSIITHPDGFVVGGFLLYENDSVVADTSIVLKFDKNGNEIWKRTYFRGYGDECSGLAIANNNNIVAVILTAIKVPYSIDGENDVVLIKYDTDGNKIWERFIGAKNTRENARGIIATADGGFLIIGTIDFPWLLKLDSLGYGPYSSWIGIEDVKTKTASLKIYPNPANEQLFVELSETQQNQEMEVFTITGEKVAEFTLQPFTQNTISVANLQNGLYLFRLKDSNSSVKVIVNH